MNNNIFDSKELNLHNGIKVISIKKETALFSLHVGVKIGSIYESNEERGASHFVEHMLFKGTKSLTNEELNKRFENLGGEYNAYTDYNCTVYSVTALYEEMTKAVELISDMIQNPSFDEKEFKKEKKVILSELNSGKDDIEDYCYTKVHEIGFSKSPLKYDTIGTKANVEGFSRNFIFDFYKKYYIPNNCFIVIVSKLEHEQVFDLVEKYFGDWNKGEVKDKDIIVEENIPKIVTSHRKDISQSSIIYMFTAYNLNRFEEAALKILNYKLGESANSILFREIRENKGLAYDIYSDLNLSKNVKTMYIYTAVNNENVKETIDSINNCIEKIKYEEKWLDDNSILLMKKVLKTSLAFTIEDTTDIGNYVLHQCMDGEDIYEFVEDMRYADTIKNEDVRKVALKVLTNPSIYVVKAKGSV
ncbi:putative Zn-dependent peptidase [Clostridium acetobutylicum]|uniref:Zn-dependent protease of MPP family n=1 Tax=Clostridium acetobutylicum (strain ATCC 824 / DSM 792 / JCM 1419 / IAM 19013 / LMG 5710 / NBRC 13948 / NRRL B-527 / VKM B-1787 / 2291 / W) TaxID=272562 RepID=Q97GF6_CLOAB|nr:MULTISPECIES: pitrilysin family protein [Clostridium]AAK80366.1 Zn-dependent protease of MPP family [Clostridium acetobutylicum ATCC 824]ADZ21463.1 Zn-dependent protease of MPP family [Clostridium acetobutylicum EA 2018]AEI32325.1 zinc-dependent protease [Clostridium acetobutylicum DSM 1731]AWV79214.1 insulinase family protein [Clostridium acetobutylicum]KHD38539.1 peptidase M16 [Clostridium acetobutylicum]